MYKHSVTFNKTVAKLVTILRKFSTPEPYKLP